MSVESVMPSNYVILCLPLLPLLCSQSFPALGSFPVSWLFASIGQSIGASALESLLLTNIQGWFPLGLNLLISWQSKGLSRVFSTPQFESISSLVLSLLYGPLLTSIHDYSFDCTDHCQQSDVCLLFNMLSRFVIAILPRSNCLNFAAAITINRDFEAQENEIWHFL